MLVFLQLCRAELGKLIGIGGKVAKSYAWSLVVPAYVAGGTINVAAALFSPLAAKWALIISGGTFGVTFWLLLLPLWIPEPLNPAEQPFVINRSPGWLVAGALCALIFVGVLGPGFPL